MIINTHTHKDHVGSNEQFPATVDIVAQENTKANMQKMDNFKGDNAKFLPKKTFKDKLELGKGKDEIDLFYFGPAHTSGDAWVVFPALRAMHAGDAFAGKNTPIIDGMNGGSAVEYGKTLAKAAAGIKNVDTIIGGHTEHPMTFADLKEYADVQQRFHHLGPRGNQGRKVAWIKPRWSTRFLKNTRAIRISTFLGGIKGNIQLAYNELQKKK